MKFGDTFSCDWQFIVGPSDFLAVLVDKRQILVDVLRRAHHEGHPLVEGPRPHIQDPLGAGGGRAPCLLHQERHRVALVQQPQLHQDTQIQRICHRTVS